MIIGSRPQNLILIDEATSPIAQGSAPERSGVGWAMMGLTPKVTGATVNVELVIDVKLGPNEPWHEVHRVTYSSAGDKDLILLEFPFVSIRAYTPTHTDGTLTLRGVGWAG